MKILVICPHFAPDTAPTGTVMTRIVEELAQLGHQIHVVTSLPWYRNHQIETGWGGRWVRTASTPLGTITRVHPFPGGDKRNLWRRAAGFIGFSALSGVTALRLGGGLRSVDVVVAMSPPLTLGLTGWLVGVARGAPLVFNIQDVFPDAAVRTGSITNQTIIKLAEWVEKVSYQRAAAITVLSDDLAANIAAKMDAAAAVARVHVIPNFVDTAQITPQDRMTSYRAELGIGDEPVVLYAGNIGFSQSLDMVVAAARQRPEVSFIINGDGAARDALQAESKLVDNLHWRDYQPIERLSEVLATGDIHVVPLRGGLGSVSVPSKTYSSLAAARPVIAAIDADTEVPRLLGAADAGIAVPPDDLEAFLEALDELVKDPARQRQLGANGRAWVEQNASPQAVGEKYHSLLTSVAKPALAPTESKLR